MHTAKIKLKYNTTQKKMKSIKGLSLMQQATACHNDSAAAFPGAGEQGGRGRRGGRSRRGQQQQEGQQYSHMEITVNNSY